MEKQNSLPSIQAPPVLGIVLAAAMGMLALVLLPAACSADRSLNPTSPYITNGTVVGNPGTATGAAYSVTNIYMATNNRYVWAASYSLPSGSPPQVTTLLSIVVTGVSPNKHIYVNDAVNNGGIFHFNFNDTTWAITPNGAPHYAFNIGNFHMMSLDPATGNIWVMDSQNWRILVLNNVGGAGAATPFQTNQFFNASSAAAGCMSSGTTPWGTAQSLPSGMILVTDRGNGRLMRFTNVTVPPNRITNISTNFYFDQVVNFGLVNLNSPTSIRHDFMRGAEQTFLVVEQGSGRIVNFDSNFNVLRILGNASTTPGVLANPVDISTNTLGQYLVVDRGNHRVVRLSGDGYFMEAIGGVNSSAANGMFYNPYGIWVDQDNMMYVVDTGNTRFQIFTNAVTAQLVTNVVKIWSNY